jgi:hypothetical protein
VVRGKSDGDRLQAAGGQALGGELQPCVRSPGGGLCACAWWTPGGGRGVHTPQSLVAVSVLGRGGLLSMMRRSCAVSSRVGLVLTGDRF